MANALSRQFECANSGATLAPIPLWLDQILHVELAEPELKDFSQMFGSNLGLVPNFCIADGHLCSRVMCYLILLFGGKLKYCTTCMLLQS